MRTAHSRLFDAHRSRRAQHAKTSRGWVTIAARGTPHSQTTLKRVLKATVGGLRPRLPRQTHLRAREHQARLPSARGHGSVRHHAEAAYRRADDRGHRAGASNLGVLLQEGGDLDGAEAAYRRAEERSNRQASPD